jgi:hypothetical protein
MTNPTKSTADLLAVLREDMRKFRHGLSGRWGGAAQELRRRLSGGGQESSGAVTKPNTKPEPGLLALLKDDIRQSLDALFGELNSLRGDKIRPPLERYQGEGITTSESPESVKGPDH